MIKKVMTVLIILIAVSLVLISIGMQLAEAGDKKQKRLHAIQSYAVGTPFNVGRVSRFDMPDGNICYIFISGDRSGMSCMEPLPMLEDDVPTIKHHEGNEVPSD
jgi:hypothetical protein|tara:strand:+ start:233 stop:544 length:312 start_codon:yes stop_codon:yes gene_type:complete